MAPSDDLRQRIADIPAEHIDLIVKLLGGKLADATPVVHQPADELYIALHKDVRRWLVELGHDENKDVRVWLLQLDAKKVRRLDAMQEGYEEAQRLGKLVKTLWWGLVAVLGGTWGFVKFLPDGLEWLKAHIK